MRLLALFLLCSVAHADPYVGFQVGQSRATIEHPGATLNQFELENTTGVARLSLGYESEWWGLEMGYTPRLSLTEAHAVTPTADVRQKFTTSAFDVRGTLGLNLTEKMQARLIGGLAWVYFENHEVGYNPEPCEWRNSGTQLLPLYGVGLRYRLNESLGLTAEFTQIQGAAKSHWTMEQTIPRSWPG